MCINLSINNYEGALLLLFQGLRTRVISGLCKFCNCLSKRRNDWLFSLFCLVEKNTMHLKWDKFGIYEEEVRQFEIFLYPIKDLKNFRKWYQTKHRGLCKNHNLGDTNVVSKESEKFCMHGNVTKMSAKEIACVLNKNLQSEMLHWFWITPISHSSTN